MLYSVNFKIYKKTIFVIFFLLTTLIFSCKEEKLRDRIIGAWKFPEGILITFYSNETVSIVGLQNRENFGKFKISDNEQELSIAIETHDDRHKYATFLVKEIKEDTIVLKSKDKRTEDEFFITRQ